MSLERLMKILATDGLSAEDAKAMATFVLGSGNPA